MIRIHKCKSNKREPLPFQKDILSKKVAEIEKANAAHKRGVSMKNRVIHSLLPSFTMKLVQNQMGLYIIDVQILNTTCKFLLDTGAQISGILSSQIHILDQSKKEQEILVKSASGQMKHMECLVIDKLYLGAMCIEHQPMVVLDEKDFKYKFLNINIMQFDGIIGWDILSQFDFEIQSEKGLFKVLDVRKQFDYQNMIPSYLPIVAIHDYKGELAMFGIDSGAHHSWLNAHYVSKQRYYRSKDKTVFQVGVFGLERVRTHFVKRCSFLLDTYKIMMKHTRIADTAVLYGYSVDGMFGNEIFQGKRVQFLNSRAIVRIIE